MAEPLLILRLGARGDGIAEDGTFVPGALPGERVRVERARARAHLVAIDEPSPDRAVPFCPYVPRCGGCAAQHMQPALYADWKRGIVADALRRARLDVEVAPLVDAHGEGRRRLTLHARFSDSGLRVGYMEARSHAVVAIDRCPIAEPGLAEAAPSVARALAERLARGKKPLDIVLTRSEGGLDVDVRGHGPLADRDRVALIDLANALDLARLSLHGEILVARRAPFFTVGRAVLVPPPGGFLQATRAGEEALSALVLEACAGARRVADLFCGSGAFALRLAETAQVAAFENDAASVAALDRAARATPGLKPVAATARDLFRRPLLVPELDGLDVVVLDPPRAGAEAQARMLAAARVPIVVSVSCDPGTFARDAGILIAAGYRLERVVPIDQFKSSPHVEVAGVLRRDVAKGRHRA